MAKATIAGSKELLISSWKQLGGVRRTLSRFTGIKQQQQQEKSAEKVANTGDEGEDEMQNMPLWFPHPKTGIYYPKGHERVMEDVPVGAASLSETCWFRSIDGADKPDPDLYSYTDI